MKKAFLFYLLAAVLNVFVSVASAQDVARMTCVKGGNSLAVQLVEQLGTPRYFSRLVLRIEDPEICRTLDLTCPFEFGAGDKQMFSAWYQQLNGDRLHFWVAVKGHNQEGVAFYSEGSGMTLVRLNTGNNPSFDYSKNWYFNYGECN
jgi:hypothetical protein